MKLKLTIILLVLTAGSLCATGISDTETDMNGDSEAMETLKIGLMPAVDTAPIFLAQEKGYFAEKGLEVEIQIYTSAQDRQSALQARAIDGAMTDLVAVAVNVAAGFDIRATTLTDGMFPILANPGAAEKKSISVGMMEVSVSNFLVDQWLGSDYEIEKVYINAIPARLEATASGQIDMGLFPEPIASIGAMKGLVKIIYAPVEGFSPDVMVFTGTALENKDAEIAAFHEAYNLAIADIQANPDLARDILIASIPNLNPALRDAMELPEYHSANLPGDDYLNMIIDWTDGIVGRDLIVTPEAMVERRFVD